MSHSEAEAYALHLLSKVKPVWLIVLSWCFLTSLIGLLIMAVDRGRAERGDWRFSEKFMIKIAYAGGCWGVFGGMVLFDHKTSKPVFMALEIGALLLWLYAFKELVALIGPPFPCGYLTG